jgi:LacI family transcriptional regulator
MSRIARPSIKDIARKVGVSVSTVSYALNDGPKPVAADLKARIMDAATELEYRPNRLARKMARRRTDIIGIVHTIHDFDFLRNSVIVEVLVGISNEARRNGQDVLFYTHPPHLQTANSHIYSDGQTDGLIFIFPDEMDATLREVRSQGIPTVVIEGEAPDGTIAIESDNRTGVKLAVQHLVELGHRDIAHVHGSLRLADAQIRLQTFQEAMREHGCRVRPEWLVDGDYTRDAGYRATQRILANRVKPTAIFAANDHSATGVMQAVRDAGLRIPTDISVIGYDDTPDAIQSQPQLTTIRQPLSEMGQAATQALIQLLAGGYVPARSSFPVELIVRASTAGPKEEPK